MSEKLALKVLNWPDIFRKILSAFFVVVFQNRAPGASASRPKPGMLYPFVKCFSKLTYYPSESAAKVT